MSVVHTESAAIGSRPHYNVICTECGRQLQGRIFPLKDLVEAYDNNKVNSVEIGQFLHMFRIVASYGAPVLPETEPLIQNEELVLPVHPESIRCQTPATFTCADNQAPRERMIPACISIASIVAQFVREAEFPQFYTMLAIERDWEIADTTGNVIPEEKKKLFESLCNELVLLPYVTVPKIIQQDALTMSIRRMMEWILLCASAEDSLRMGQEDKTSFAASEYLVGWRYDVVNERRMPMALTVLRAATGEVIHIKDSCCSQCMKPVPYTLGAYEQRIVGLLGTQATGKSTYLAAFEDTVKDGELTGRRIGSSDLKTRFTVKECLDGDAQWTRAKNPPSTATGEGETGKGGCLWHYSHGFPPAKNEVAALDSPALTFLVTPEDGEPVMYVMADISGEAFYNKVSNDLDSKFVESQHRILKSCRSIFMVINSRQMRMSKQDDSAAPLVLAKNGKADDLVTDPQEILTCIQEFLPQDLKSAAVIVTASDCINGGNLCAPFHLGFDPGKVPALIQKGDSSWLGYNAEVMANLSNACSGYLDRNFGNYMSNFRSAIRQKLGREGMAAAFPISNGTQEAPYYFKDEIPGSAEDSGESAQERYDLYHSKENCEKRLLAMRGARFGVVNPFLWMLACDGLLESAAADQNLVNADARTRAAAEKRLLERLEK